MDKNLQSIQNIDELSSVFPTIQDSARRVGRPFVMVTYAQSIDGSIATRDRRPLRLSGPASMTLTHRLRSLFDGILVGIETVLADDPQLTVRLVEGANPQPVVLDTRLRTPIESRLLRRSDRSSWLVSGEANASDRAAALVRAGGTVLPCGVDGYGRVDLDRLMGLLLERGISTLMVEGGSRVITSFIQARLVDLFVITLSPVLTGGLQVLENRNETGTVDVGLADLHCERVETDLVLWARPVWRSP